MGFMGSIYNARRYQEGSFSRGAQAGYRQAGFDLLLLTGRNSTTSVFTIFQTVVSLG